MHQQALFPFSSNPIWIKIVWKSVSRGASLLNLEFYVWFMSAVCSPVPVPLSVLARIELPLLHLIYVTRDGGAPHLVQIHFAFHKKAFCDSRKYICNSIKYNDSLDRYILNWIKIASPPPDLCDQRWRGCPPSTWCKEKLFSISPQTAICRCPPPKCKDKINIHFKMNYCVLQ